MRRIEPVAYIEINEFNHPIWMYLIGKNSVLAIIHITSKTLVGYDLNTKHLYLLDKKLTHARVRSGRFEATRDRVYAESMEAVYNYRPSIQPVVPQRLFPPFNPGYSGGFAPAPG